MLPVEDSRQTPSLQRRKPGRPRALDETKRREVCALISAGCGIDDAARYVGCAASTIRREADRNPQFDERLRRAALAAELTPLNDIRQAAKKYWRAAAWLLERANPQRFGKQDVRFLKPEQFGQYLDLLAGIVRQEVADEATRQRIAQRLLELRDLIERESWAKREPIAKRPNRKGYRPNH